MKKIVIEAENISKYYSLGQINTGSFYKDMQSFWARKRGKEDPNLRLDQKVSTQEGFWALKDINFQICQGDKVGIIGRNGAGKSTLLKVLSQVTSPTTGTIGINGKVASLLEVGTGFHPEMTGRENIYLNGAILGMKRAEINDKINEIIDFSEINEHIDTPVKRYSSGMYVRLAFAVAAHLNSDILIADEVLAVGDATFQKKALGKMNDLSSGEGKTVLFVSHQMNAVKALCNTGMILDKGKTVFNGRIEDCIVEYQKNLYNMETITNLSDFDNEFFDLLDFEIIDINGEKVTTAMTNDQKYFVRIVFNLKKQHSGFCLGYSLHDNEGNIVYWSYPSDDYRVFQQPHLGENVIWGEIPCHFVNEGDYYVYLQGGIHFQEWLIDPSKDAPYKRISIRGGLSDSPFWHLKRPGMCAPILKWEVKE